MDQIKTGETIRQFRTKKGLTQKQLAEKLGVSDKAVSKWERGRGCPDVSLLASLADVFGADMSALLSGEVNKNEREKGNMKKLRFYICKECGNVVTATSEAAVTCCGDRLVPLEAKKAEEGETLRLEHIDGELFVSSDHAMTKEYYIPFVAYLNDSVALIRRLYPEWELQFSLPPYRSGRLVWYCPERGLLYQDLRGRSKCRM